MNTKNPYIKHGLSEIVNAAKKEERDEIRSKLTSEIKRQKNGALPTERVLSIIDRICE